MILTIVLASILYIIIGCFVTYKLKWRANDDGFSVFVGFILSPLVLLIYIWAAIWDCVIVGDWES